MPFAGPLLAIALAACSSPGEADAALARLDALAPDADLAAAGSVLAECGPAASTPERRARAEADLAALRRVAEVERRVALIFPAGGKPRAQVELDAAAGEVRQRPELVARLAADGRAMDRIEAALAEAGGGKWATAAPLLEVALADPAVRRVEGAEGLKALERTARRARWEASPWAQALVAARSLAWLVGLFAAAAAVLALARLFTRGGRGAPARYDIALHEGEAASSALALQLLGELRGLRTGPSITAEPAGDLGSVAVVRVPALDEQLQALAARLDESAAISIGFVKVPLRDLWLGLTRLLFPPRYVWRGALTRHLDETRFALQQRDRRTGKRREWIVRVPGTDDRARAEAARRMACQIAISELPGAPPTRSVEAFVSYEAARDLLDDLPEGAPAPKLEEGRALLERAVREDPSWETPQRRLAGVVARLGEVDLGLEIISGLARAAPVPRPELMYEEARICAWAGDPRRVRRALALVEKTLATPGISKELEISARSLRAAAAAGLLSLAEREDEVALSETERGRLQEALTDELTFFGEASDGIDPRAFSLARGLAQAARGGWLIEAGRAREALVAFREVLVCQPDLLAAQLGIARAYRKAQPRGWYEQAIPWLERAERLAPGNPVAHYEHGSALLVHRPPDVDGAEAHLRKAAGQNLAALYKLGVLLAEERGQVLEGLRCLDRALEGRGARAAPYWAQKMVEVAASARPMPPLALDLAEKALAALAEAYQEHAEPEPDEDQDDRAARLAERRRLRRYLARAACTLNEALSELSDAEAGQASREVDRAAETLTRTLSGFQAELESPELEERDRAVLERAIADLSSPGARAAAPRRPVEPAGGVES